MRTRHYLIAALLLLALACGRDYRYDTVTPQNNPNEAPAAQVLEITPEGEFPTYGRAKPLTDGLKFRVNKYYESYEWTIGDDPRVFTTREVVLKFSGVAGKVPYRCVVKDHEDRTTVLGGEVTLLAQHEPTDIYSSHYKLSAKIEGTEEYLFRDRDLYLKDTTYRINQWVNTEKKVTLHYNGLLSNINRSLVWSNYTIVFNIPLYRDYSNIFVNINHLHINSAGLVFGTGSITEFINGKSNKTIISFEGEKQ